MTMAREPYDGMIMAAISYSNSAGSYYRISYFGLFDGRLVQCDSRAADYVDRYGIEAAVKNAAAHDPNFDILKNLENSRKGAPAYDPPKSPQG